MIILKVCGGKVQAVQSTDICDLGKIVVIADSNTDGGKEYYPVGDDMCHLSVAEVEPAPAPCSRAGKDIGTWVDNHTTEWETFL